MPRGSLGDKQGPRELGCPLRYTQTVQIWPELISATHAHGATRKHVFVSAGNKFGWNLLKTAGGVGLKWSRLARPGCPKRIDWLPIRVYGLPLSPNDHPTTAQGFLEVWQMAPRNRDFSANPQRPGNSSVLTGVNLGSFEAAPNSVDGQRQWWRGEGGGELRVLFSLNSTSCLRLQQNALPTVAGAVFVGALPTGHPSVILSVTEWGQWLSPAHLFWPRRLDRLPSELCQCH